MKPGEVGKKLGIGMRVAGRIAKQRAAQQGQQAAGEPAGTAAAAGATIPLAAARNLAGQVQQIRAQAPRYSRAAGRGIGGFLRPFGRVGGILWLEVSGFFFGLVGLYFAVGAWRARADYAHGPLRQHFWIALGCLVVFAYLSVSSFWRASRK
jgi:hypothetical protein